ncbi:sodium- and chloride-dependent neutral and basic amino acid transporter B(0+)-like [Schistocerca piceifrons]|uniref:sodium- and chloride-dependent neutral and basic amino acid transporter B(0+)-like n=1 Tax=Schistocerca piceifrons TaxID=274613 RepID=UPI001F5E5C0F|nr:sodium- and chloride-dependent neutral and basic amino acid transporter B(0+)-like [Schistocerca piceifrons]
MGYLCSPYTCEHWDQVSDFTKSLALDPVGPGAFLIPFSVMLVIAGLPLMFMELSFGQFASLGPVAIYQAFCPLFRGLGYGMVIVSAIVMLYYNLIIAWTIFYMFASLRPVLPWQNCEPEWSTDSE